MKIKIKDKEVTLVQKMRTLLIYEALANKPFNPQTITDVMLYFYSTILACAGDVEMDFNEFLDWLDENPNQFEIFNIWLSKENKTESQFVDKEEKKKENH